MDLLITKPLRQRAYSVLSFIAHGYIYGVPGADEVDCILPKSVAVPWFNVAKMLHIHPVASYSSVGLWNWYLLDPKDPIDLSNLATIDTYSGAYDESWFYLVPLAIEIQGAPVINAIIDAQHAVLSNDTSAVEQCMRTIADTIQTFTATLKRMYEKCDPSVFWNRIRPYSGGSKNSEALPNGLFYEGVLEIDAHVEKGVSIPAGLSGTWRKYPGASAGQSPLIHTIDVALGIEHKPIGAVPSKCPVSGTYNTHGIKSCPASGSKSINPMLEMRESLPGEFQEFIRHLAVAPSIKNYCESSTGSIVVEFNRACTSLKEFRDQHLQLATKYIVLQRRGGKAVGTGGIFI